MLDPGKRILRMGRGRTRHPAPRDVGSAITTKLHREVQNHSEARAVVPRIELDSMQLTNRSRTQSPGSKPATPPPHMPAASPVTAPPAKRNVRPLLEPIKTSSLNGGHALGGDSPKLLARADELIP
jgi:hypothetical protein